MVIWARLFVQVQTSFVLVESGHCNDGKLSHFLLVQPRCDAGSLGLASLVWSSGGAQAFWGAAQAVILLPCS